MPAPTYDTIAATTLASAQASVTFGAIPQTYTDLILTVNGATVSNSVGMLLTFNGDSSANYNYNYMYGDGAGATPTNRQTNSTNIQVGRGDSTAGVSVMHIFNYYNTTTYKAVLSKGCGPTSGNISIYFCGFWRNTNPILSLTITPSSGNFATNAVIALYGLKAAT